MNEARQRGIQRPAGQGSWPEEDVMRRLEEAVNRYYSIMELADMDDGMNADRALPVEYSWDNPIGLVVSEKLQGRSQLGFVFPTP